MVTAQTLTKRFFMRPGTHKKTFWLWQQQTISSSLRKCWQGVGAWMDLVTNNASCCRCVVTSNNNSSRQSPTPHIKEKTLTLLDINNIIRFSSTQRHRFITTFFVLSFPTTTTTTNIYASIVLRVPVCPLFAYGISVSEQVFAILISFQTHDVCHVVGVVSDDRLDVEGWVIHHPCFICNVMHGSFYRNNVYQEFVVVGIFFMHKKHKVDA